MIRDRRPALLPMIAAAVIVITLGQGSPAPAQPTGELRTGQAAFGDWSQDAPGIRRRITAADLGPQTPSSAKSSKVIARPADYAPMAPPGFQVKVVHHRPEGPARDEGRAQRRRLRHRDQLRPYPRDPSRGERATSPRISRCSPRGLPQPSGIAFYPAADPQWVYVGETEHNRALRLSGRRHEGAGGRPRPWSPTLSTPGGHFNPRPDVHQGRQAAAGGRRLDPPTTARTPRPRRWPRPRPGTSRRGSPGPRGAPTRGAPTCWPSVPTAAGGASTPPASATAWPEPQPGHRRHLVRRERTGRARRQPGSRLRHPHQGTAATTAGPGGTSAATRNRAWPGSVLTWPARPSSPTC